MAVGSLGRVPVPQEDVVHPGGDGSANCRCVDELPDGAEHGLEVVLFAPPAHQQVQALIDPVARSHVGEVLAGVQAQAQVAHRALAVGALVGPGGVVEHHVGLVPVLEHLPAAHVAHAEHLREVQHLPVRRPCAPAPSLAGPLLAALLRLRLVLPQFRLHLRVGLVDAEQKDHVVLPEALPLLPHLGVVVVARQVDGEGAGHLAGHQLAQAGFGHLVDVQRLQRQSHPRPAPEGHPRTQAGPRPGRELGVHPAHGVHEVVSHLVRALEPEQRVVAVQVVVHGEKLQVQLGQSQNRHLAPGHQRQPAATTGGGGAGL
mmetsp:Transcript_4861/g.10596  ORF Transcript_4861/g.10596 Transcript_4861/m.10596 type:complete len:316 (-) Transcript_4861:240-1187(-)